MIFSEIDAAQPLPDLPKIGHALNFLGGSAVLPSADRRMATRTPMMPITTRNSTGVNRASVLNIPCRHTGVIFLPGGRRPIAGMRPWVVGHHQPGAIGTERGILRTRMEIEIHEDGGWRVFDLPVLCPVTELCGKAGVFAGKRGSNREGGGGGQSDFEGLKRFGINVDAVVGHCRGAVPGERIPDRPSAEGHSAEPDKGEENLSA